MDFDLPEDIKLFQELMRRFVDRELIPLEAQGDLDAETRDGLREKAKAAGLWMLDVPVELGGQGLSALGMSIFWEELSRTAAIAPRDTQIFRSLIGPILLAEGAFPDAGDTRRMDAVLCDNRSRCRLGSGSHAHLRGA